LADDEGIPIPLEIEMTILQLARPGARLLLALALAIPLAACGGGSGSAAAPPAPLAAATSLSTAETRAADIRVLMMGNSHTSVNNLPAMLAAMLRAGRPGKTVAVVVAPTWATLDQHLNNVITPALFNAQSWSAVVLQAQQYSSSGAFEYSIAEAVQWSEMVRAKQAVPVMFPEWPRLGIDETQRIFDLHLRIAKLAPACVPPIPQSFDLAAVRLPGVVLHDADGNHSAPNGAFLAALVLYATMTGNAPQALPDLGAFAIDSATQGKLRAVADEQVRLLSPRALCPNDVFI
jgi:hypothetical protein